MSKASAVSADALQEQLARLERENEQFRASVASHSSESGEHSSRRPLRSFASLLCILIATLLIPVSVIVSWTSLRLVDESAFVDTFAPLASDEAVQDAIIVEINALLEESVDIDGLTDVVFDGVGELALPDRAAAAFDLLRGPAAFGVRNAMKTAVTEFVRSDLFAGAWESALRLSHRTLVATAQGSALNGAVTVSDTGTIAIQLAPILEQARSSLADSGFPVPASIPSINASITVAQNSALPLVATVYLVTSVVSWWLPLVAIAFCALGVVLARRRSGAIVGSGIGIALGGASVLIAFALGGIYLHATAVQMSASTGAVSAIFEQTVHGMRSSAQVLVVLGIAVVILGWSRGRSRLARAMQSGLAGVNSAIGERLTDHGVSAGRFGKWASRNGTLIGVLVLIVAVLALIWLPFSVAAIFWVTACALLVWWGLTLSGSVASVVKPDDSADSTA